MYVTTKFSPVTITIQSAKEWKTFKRIFKDVCSSLEHKRSGGYNPLVSHRNLSEEEQEIYYMCNKLLKDTELVPTNE